MEQKAPSFIPKSEKKEDLIQLVPVTKEDLLKRKDDQDMTFTETKTQDATICMEEIIENNVSGNVCHQPLEGKKTNVIHDRSR